MNECIFCSILAGKQTGTFVYRDDLVAVFMDIHPINIGHLLVVPISHTPGLADLPPSVGAHMFFVAQRMAQAIRDSGLPCEGANLFLADGRAAMQEVLHVHLHIIPRVRGDGFGLKFGARHPIHPSRAELSDAAEKIGAKIIGCRC